MSIPIYKQHQQKQLSTRAYVCKLKVTAKILGIAAVIILIGIFPINNGIGISTTFLSNTMVKEDNNNSKIKIQQEQQYCFYHHQQQKVNSNPLSSIHLAAYDDADSTIDKSSININPICLYAITTTTTIMSKNLILSLSSSSTSFKSKKLVHSSIRVEEEVFNSLQKEAERLGISFNSLINKTLKNYVTSEMHFEQLGFLLVSKDFLRKTFAELEDEKRLDKLGKELGLTVAKEYVSYFFPNVDSCTLAQFLEIWFRRFQSYKHMVDTKNTDNVIIEEEEKKQVESEIQGQQQQEKQNKQEMQQRKEIHVFTVYHDININFSIVLKAILEGLIEPITKSPVAFKDITANSISFSFFSITLSEKY